MADTLHRDMVDTELHETKGIAAASVNQVLLADGGGSGAWSDNPAVPEAPIDGRMYVRRDAGWTLNPSDPSVLSYKMETSNHNPGPLTGTIRYNNADQTLTTELYMSGTDAFSRNVQPTLLNITIGAIVSIVDYVNLGQRLNFSVQSATNVGGTSVTYGVTFISVLGAPFEDGQDILGFGNPAPA